MDSIDKKSRGLLINITGNGKGKTTSSLGTCVRALGWGWKVRIIQFVKDKRETGEKRFFENIAKDSDLEICQCGLGCTWKSKWTKEEHATAALEAWKKAEESIKDSEARLLVLDELNIALDAGWLDKETVLSNLKNRPEEMNIIVTGRYSPEWLVDICDLVSEVKEIKHPYKKGIKARKGIEF